LSLYIVGGLSNQGKFCSVCEVTNVICSIHPLSRNKNAEFNSSTAASADSIRINVHQISSLLQTGRQEDSNEFLIFLFDHFITCLPTHLSLSSILSSTPTIIGKTFTIKLLSSLQCSSCPYTSHKEESHNMLLLEINNLYHIKDALAHFVGLEIIHEFTCGNCTKSAGVNKRITIHGLSPVLIINFKRYGSSLNLTGKLLHQVRYDELLDISSCMTSYFTTTNDNKENINPSNNYFYKLYAVINHIGDDLHSGHYYSYVRSSDNLWFIVDDLNCRVVPSKEVFNHPNALILFYAKECYMSTNNNPSFELQQSLMTLPKQNDPIFYSSPIIDSSV